MEKATLESCREWASKLHLYDSLTYTDVQTSLLVVTILEGVLTLVSLVAFLIPVKRIQVRNSWIIATVLYGHFTFLSMFFDTANRRTAMTIDKPLAQATAECRQRFGIKLPVSNANNNYKKYFEVQTRTHFHTDTIFIFACCCIAGLLFLRLFHIMADSKSAFNDIVHNFNTSFKPSIDINEIYSQPPSVASSSTVADFKMKLQKDTNIHDESSCESHSTCDSSSSAGSIGMKEREKGDIDGDLDSIV